MPEYRTPGVYLEEAPLLTPTEELGASAAVACFIGAASKGPIDTPSRLESWNDYVTRFGGFERIVGVDEDPAEQANTVYVRATAAGVGSTTLAGIVSARQGDLGLVNAYRGTLARFYRYVDGESGETGFAAPHDLYVFDGASWVDTGLDYNAASPLFQTRTDILGGLSPAANLIVVDEDPTLTPPSGIAPAYGDLAFYWDAGTSTFKVYVYGSNNSTFFDGSGAASSEAIYEVAIDATGGTFTITVEGQETTALAYNASATTVLNALNALSNVAPGDFTVSKASSTFTITATDDGAFGNTDITITADGASLTGGAGTATATETQQGGQAGTTGTYDATHGESAGTSIALPVGWNLLTSTTQGNATGLDSNFSSDGGVADLWGPLRDSGGYVSGVDLTGISGFETWTPTFASDTAGTEINGLSYLPYSVYNFFQNGGRTAYVIRSIDHTRGGVSASRDWLDADGGVAFTLSAKGAGTWGNKISVLVTQQTSAGALAYTLRVYYNLNTEDAPAWQEVERFTNLSMSGNTPGLRRFDIVVNDPGTGSQYVVVSNLAPSPLAGADAIDPDTISTPLAERTLGSGVLGTNPGLPQAADLLQSATENVSKIDGAVLANVAGWTSDINDETKFVSVFLNSSLWPTRADIFCVNDGFEPRLGRSVASYMTLLNSTSVGNTSSDSYTADFAPWVVVKDPSVTGGTISVPPGGVVIGVMARTDAQEGAFRSAAGVRAVTNALGVETKFTDAQLGTLNGQHINVLRPVAGQSVCIMGARTRKFYGADLYIAPRRTLIYIENALRNATQFAVFENNDERLWARLIVTADRVLRPIWNLGGLRGTTSSQAYFIKCDETINTSQVIQSGEVRMEVGVALEYPAEFVVIRVSQFDGGSTAITDITA